VAVLSLIVPVVLVSVGQLELGSEEDLLLSRIISGFMLATYVCYVFFQLVTHKALFEEQGDEDGEDDEEEVVLSLNGAICWLAISTVLIAYLSEGLTAAIEGAAEGWGMSETFVGFIILPIVGNAAEHSTAVVMANKGKMDLAIGVALGSSTQIALMVIPTMVLLAAPMHQPLSLCFGVFETIVTFVSVLVVGMVIVDGETNWLEGVMLLMAYCIIGTAFWFYHG
jgi:Ca2+:H+ antiporter|tara:strand:- start:653 stop:1327 length:675 start_codon:yes stop_codon:yes gene_type:complete